MPETIAQQLVRGLKRHKVECFFGQSLPSALVLAAEAVGIRQIAYRQENSGGAMADGFARISGKVGIVVGQNGPAATLLVAPLAEALKASVPVIALVQEVDRPFVDRNAFQELDHFALFSGVAKYIRRITDPKRVDDYLDAAFIAATSGRPGPAVLLLPADLLKEASVQQDYERKASLGHWPLERGRPSDAEIGAAAKVLAEARHPVIWAGGGVLHADAQAVLQALSDDACIPVFTTHMGKGAVEETHSLACGVYTALNGPRSLAARMHPIMQEADAVLLVGTRTNQNGTDNWKLLPKGAKLMQIDVDPMEIGRTYEAMRLVGDAQSTLQALHKAMMTTDLGSRRNARPALEARIAKAWAEFDGDRQIHTASNKSPIRPERLMAELQMLLTQDTTVVADASYSSMWVVGQLRGSHRGARFLTPRGLAGLGWGVPMAMGVAIARPGKPVIAIAGDGGFAHNWAEIETMVRCDIPVVTVILNNGVLGFQKDAETVKFGAFTSACTFAPVNHADIARACGCASLRVSDPGDIGPVLREALASGKPWLIELMTDPDAHPALSIFDGTLDHRV